MKLIDDLVVLLNSGLSGLLSLLGLPSDVSLELLHLLVIVLLQGLAGFFLG